MNNPLVSIIMPFYNAENYIEKAINSILRQTYKNYELIIINDASTDNSDSLIKKYLNNKKIIYVKNNKNYGIVHNLNKGINLAKGIYIARMDGDDISLETRIEKQVKFLEKNLNIDIVGCFAEVIDENGIFLKRQIKKPVDPESVYKYLFQFLTIIHGTALMRKSLLDKVGGYNQNYLYMEDIEFTYRAIFSGHLGANIPEALYLYRYHPNSSAINNKNTAIKVFNLRKKIIRENLYNVKIKDRVLMYIQFLAGILLKPRHRQMVEKIYKKIFHGE